MLEFLYKSLENAFMYFGLVALFCFSALTAENILIWFSVCFLVAILYNASRKLKNNNKGI
jgi:hypothetical protein